MTLEQLRIFLIVAEELNMTRAAARLHLTQPAVSAAIAALEGRHATKLFDRVGRRIELTEAGRLFRPEAAAVLSRANEASQMLDDLAGLRRGTIRIAASQTVATYWLPPRMAAFADAHPGIRQHLSVGNSDQAAAMLLAGEADLAFVEGEIDDALLSVTAIGGDQIAIYAAADHPLLTGRLTAEQLRDASWVMREPGSGTRNHLGEGLRQSGIDVAALDVALELPSNGAVLAAIAGGRLIGGVSELAAAARVQAGSIKPLRWSFPRRAFTMLRHRARRPSRAVEAFVGTM